MWFLRQRRNKADEEATLALEDARKNLKKVEERGAEVSKVANALREIRERNHFAEEMEAIILHQGKTP